MHLILYFVRLLKYRDYTEAVEKFFFFFGNIPVFSLILRVFLLHTVASKNISLNKESSNYQKNSGNLTSYFCENTEAFGSYLSHQYRYKIERRVVIVFMSSANIINKKRIPLLIIYLCTKKAT